MDTLTHGLLGAALAALPLPRRLDPGARTPLRASVLASVLAAELPDLDYVLPSPNAVLATLAAHRGYSHSLLSVPVVALLATLLTLAAFRRAAFAPLYVRALLSVPLAHLLPDVWTGWGTRLFLPWSSARVALDWTMVVDPLLTAPLAVAALWAALEPRRFRPAMAIGGTALALYVLLRVASSVHLTREVARAYPSATSVDVFPALLGVARWRYVVRAGAEYAAGDVRLGEQPREAARHPARRLDAMSLTVAEAPTVREALAWARFPLVTTGPGPRNTTRVTVADLRYHLDGAPTLTFVIDVDRAGRVTSARLERGGSARELWERFRRVAGRQSAADLTGSRSAAFNKARQTASVLSASSTENGTTRRASIF